MEELVFIIENIFAEEIADQNEGILYILDKLKAPIVTPHELIRVYDYLDDFSDSDETIIETLDVIKDDLLLKVSCQDFAKALDNLLNNNYNSGSQSSQGKRRIILNIKKALETEDLNFDIMDKLHDIIANLKSHDDRML